VSLATPSQTGPFFLQQCGSSIFKNTHFKPASVAHTYNIASWEAEIRRIVFKNQLGQIVYNTPISKITRAKWTGGVAQEVECLLCK
jgi:hypothetical protein